MSAATTELLRAGFVTKSVSLRSLQLLAGLSTAEAADFCRVPFHTYRRWRTSRTPNPTAVRLLAIRAGYLPWPGWEGWEMHEGLLFPPGYQRHGIAPGEITALPFLLQLARTLPPRTTQRRRRWADWARRA